MLYKSLEKREGDEELFKAWFRQRDIHRSMTKSPSNALLNEIKENWFSEWYAYTPERSSISGDDWYFSSLDKNVIFSLFLPTWNKKNKTSTLFSTTRHHHF